MEIASNIGVIACPHVIAGEPVRHLAYDWDGDLQVLCGGPHPDDGPDPEIRCLGHFVETDSTLIEPLQALELGTSATRTAPGAPWVIESIPPEEQAA